MVVSNLVSLPIRLPRHRDLLTLPHNSQEHPMAKKLTMVAVIISGNSSKVREFQLQHLRSSSVHGKKEQVSSMLVHGNSGIFGVCCGVSIPLLRLKR